MAGVPARLYHYGAYLTPALIRQASGLRSYAAFAGILAPMGVFFTGLGAYALFGSFWGRWPGLAAAAALLLLPDGAQQGGMQNTFMSYHWLTQISPSASYGLALLALAWLFVLLGCKRGQPLAARHGLADRGDSSRSTSCTSSSPARCCSCWFPRCSFGGPWGPASEPCGRVSAAAVYVVTIVASSGCPAFPRIRFDGSGVGELFTLIKGFAQRGGLA